MARRGRYGQVPSAAPSLTNTIISIARQMQADRETNLMDAWRHGGNFEGKPVTDEMVLAFWHERLKDVDKADPAYDTYANTISQTEYSIAESKMSTWYAKSKGDATADRKMASFYSHWSGKIPKDSEFYRVLQRDAAQFIRAAIAKEKAAAGGGGGHGRGSGGPTKAQLKAKAYADAQSKTYQDHEQLGAFLTSAFTTIAKGQGLIGVSPNADLTDFDPTDPAKMLAVIDQINKNPKAVVYYTSGGAVTGQAILDVVKQLDPHFDGKLTTAYYGKALTNQITGQQTRLDLATSTGHKVDMHAISKAITATTEGGRESNAWSIEQSYQQMRSNFLHTWLSPTSTPDQKVAAWNTYSKGIIGLATSKTRPPDQNTYSRLVAEVTGDGSVDSLAENFTGLKAGDHSSVNGAPTGDIADTHASLQNLIGQQQAVATGQAVWAMGTTGSDGAFHPGAGREIGAASPADVQAASPEGAIRVYVTQAGGRAIPVWVAGKKVTATVVDAQGFKVNSTNPDATQVATAYDVSIDGQTTRLYAYQSPTGTTLYTTDAPWGANVQAHDTGGAVQLTVRLSGVPSEATVGKDSNFTIVRNADGSVKDITVDPGSFVLTETDPARHMAGPDPHTDSLSPSIAYYLASPQTLSELSALQQGDGGFRHSVDMDLRLAAGGQYDAATGSIVGGDPALYNEGAAQVGFAYRMNDPRAEGLGPAGGEVFFGRSTTRGTFETAPPRDAPTPPAPAGFGAGTGPRLDGLLPSDQARGTVFGALAGAFQPGTNRIQTSAGEPKDAFLIQGPQQLRLPSPPAATSSARTPVTPAPLPVQPPTPAPVPVAPPGPTDTLTPTPVAPLPLPTPVYGSQDNLTSGGGAYAAQHPAATPTPTPKVPKATPAAPRTGARPQ